MSTDMTTADKFQHNFQSFLNKYPHLINLTSCDPLSPTSQQTSPGDSEYIITHHLFVDMVDLQIDLVGILTKSMSTSPTAIKTSNNQTQLSPCISPLSSTTSMALIELSDSDQNSSKEIAAKGIEALDVNWSDLIRKWFSLSPPQLSLGQPDSTSPLGLQDDINPTSLDINDFILYLVDVWSLLTRLFHHIITTITSPHSPNHHLLQIILCSYNDVVNRYQNDAMINNTTMTQTLIPTTTTTTTTTASANQLNNDITIPIYLLMNQFQIFSLLLITLLITENAHTLFNPSISTLSSHLRTTKQHNDTITQFLSSFTLLDTLSFNDNIKYTNKPQLNQHSNVTHNNISASIQHFHSTFLSSSNHPHKQTLTRIITKLNSIGLGVDRVDIERIYQGLAISTFILTRSQNTPHPKHNTQNTQQNVQADTLIESNWDIIILTFIIYPLFQFHSSREESKTHMMIMGDMDEKNEEKLKKKSFQSHFISLFIETLITPLINSITMPSSKECSKLDEKYQQNVRMNAISYLFVSFLSFVSSISTITQSHLLFTPLLPTPTNLIKTSKLSLLSCLYRKLNGNDKLSDEMKSRPSIVTFFEHVHNILPTTLSTLQSIAINPLILNKNNQLHQKSFSKATQAMISVIIVQILMRFIQSSNDSSKFTNPKAPPKIDSQMMKPFPFTNHTQIQHHLNSLYPHSIPIFKPSWFHNHDNDNVHPLPDDSNTANPPKSTIQDFNIELVFKSTQSNNVAQNELMTPSKGFHSTTKSTIVHDTSFQWSIVITSPSSLHKMNPNILDSLKQLINICDTMVKPQLETVLIIISTFIEHYLVHFTHHNTLNTTSKSDVLSAIDYHGNLGMVQVQEKDCRKDELVHPIYHTTYPTIIPQSNPLSSHIHTQPMTITSNYRDIIDTISQSFELSELNREEYLEQLKSGGRRGHSSKETAPSNGNSKQNPSSFSQYNELYNPWTKDPVVRDEVNPLLNDFFQRVKRFSDQDDNIAMLADFTWGNIHFNSLILDNRPLLISDSIVNGQRHSSDASKNPNSCALTTLMPSSTKVNIKSNITNTNTSMNDVYMSNDDLYDKMPGLIPGNDQKGDKGLEQDQFDDVTRESAPSETRNQFNIADPIDSNTHTNLHDSIAADTKELSNQITMDNNQFTSSYSTVNKNDQKDNKLIVQYYQSTFDLNRFVSSFGQCEEGVIHLDNLDGKMTLHFASYLFKGIISNSTFDFISNNVLTLLLCLMGQLIDLGCKKECTDMISNQTNETKQSSLLDDIINLVRVSSTTVSLLPKNLALLFVTMIIIDKMIANNIIPTPLQSQSLIHILITALPNLSNLPLFGPLVHIISSQLLGYLGLFDKDAKGVKFPWLSSRKTLNKSPKWIYMFIYLLFYQLSQLNPITYTQNLMKTALKFQLELDNNKDKEVDMTALPCTSLSSFFPLLTSPSLALFHLSSTSYSLSKALQATPYTTILHKVNQTLSFLFQITPNIINNQQSHQLSPSLLPQSQLIPISLLPQSISTINITSNVPQKTQHLATISHHKLLIQHTKQTTKSLKRDSYAFQTKSEAFGTSKPKLESTIPLNSHSAMTNKPSSDVLSCEMESIPYIHQPSLPLNYKALNSSLLPITTKWSPFSLFSPQTQQSQMPQHKTLIELLRYTAQRYVPFLKSGDNKGSNNVEKLPFLDLSTAYEMLFLSDLTHESQSNGGNDNNEDISVFTLWKYECLTMYKTLLSTHLEIMMNLQQTITTSQNGSSLLSLPINRVVPNDIISNAVSSIHECDNTADHVSRIIPTSTITPHLHTLTSIYNAKTPLDHNSPFVKLPPMTKSIKDIEGMISNEELLFVLKSYLKSQFFPSQTSINLLSPQSSSTNTVKVLSNTTSSVLLPTMVHQHQFKQEYNQQSGRCLQWDDDFHQTITPITTTTPIATLIPALSPFALASIITIILDRVELALLIIIESNKRGKHDLNGDEKSDQGYQHNLFINIKPAEFITSATQLLFMLLLTLLPWSQQLTSIQYERLFIVTQRHNQILTNKTTNGHYNDSSIKLEDASKKFSSNSNINDERRGCCGSINSYDDLTPINIVPILQSNTFLLTSSQNQSTIDQDVSISSGSDYITQNIRSKYLSLQLEGVLGSMNTRNDHNTNNFNNNNRTVHLLQDEIDPIVSQLDSNIWMTSTRLLSRSRFDEMENSITLPLAQEITCSISPTLSPNDTTMPVKNKVNTENHKSQYNSHQIRLQCSEYITALRSQLVKFLQRIVDYLPLIDRSLLSNYIDSSTHSKPLDNQIDSENNLNCGEPGQYNKDDIEKILLSSKLNHLFSIPSLGGPDDLDYGSTANTDDNVNNESNIGVDPMNNQSIQQLIDTNYALFSVRFLYFISSFMPQTNINSSSNEKKSPKINNHVISPLSLNNRPPTLSTALQLIQNLNTSMTNTKLSLTIERFITRFFITLTTLQTNISTNDWLTLVDYLSYIEMPMILPGVYKRSKEKGLSPLQLSSPSDHLSTQQSQQSNQHPLPTNITTELEFINFLFPLLLLEFDSGAEVLGSIIPSSSFAKMTLLEKKIIYRFCQSTESLRVKLSSLRLKFKRFIRDRLVSFLSVDGGEIDEGFVNSTEDNNKVSDDSTTNNTKLELNPFTPPPRPFNNPFMAYCINIFDPFRTLPHQDDIVPLNQFMYMTSSFIYSMLDLPPHYFVQRYSPSHLSQTHSSEHSSIQSFVPTSTVQIEPIVNSPSSQTTTLLHSIPTTLFSTLCSASQVFVTASSQSQLSTPTIKKKCSSTSTPIYRTSSPQELNYLRNFATLHFDVFSSSRLLLFQTQMCQVDITSSDSHSNINNNVMGVSTEEQKQSSTEITKSHPYVMFPNPFLSFNKALMYPATRKQSRIYVDVIFTNLLSFVNHLWSHQVIYLNQFLQCKLESEQPQSLQLSSTQSTIEKMYNNITQHINNLTVFSVAVFDLVELILISNVNSYYSLNLQKIPLKQFPPLSHYDQTDYNNNIYNNRNVQLSSDKSTAQKQQLPYSLLTILSSRKSNNDKSTNNSQMNTPSRQYNQHHQHQYIGGIHSLRPQQQPQHQRRDLNPIDQHHSQVLTFLSHKFNPLEHYSNGINSGNVTTIVGNNVINNNDHVKRVFDGFSTSNSKVPLGKISRIHIDFCLQLWSIISSLLIKFAEIEQWDISNKNNINNNMQSNDDHVEMNSQTKNSFTIKTTYLSYKFSHPAQSSPNQQQQTSSSLNNQKNKVNSTNPIKSSLNTIKSLLKIHLDFDLDWYSSYIPQRGALSRSFPMNVQHHNVSLCCDSSDVDTSSSNNQDGNATSLHLSSSSIPQQSSQIHKTPTKPTDTTNLTISPTKSILSHGFVHPLGAFMGYLMQYLTENQLSSPKSSSSPSSQTRLYHSSQQLVQKLRTSMLQSTRRTTDWA